MTNKKYLNRDIFLYTALAFGWCFLLFNIFTSPFKFEFKWVLYFIGIFVAVNASWWFLLWAYSGLTKKDTDKIIFYKNDGFKIHLPWFLYTPAEDGLCLVPLLYTGINYFTAGVGAFAFSLLHFFSYSFWACVPKGIAFFLVAFFILTKSGIAPIVVGHWIIDIFWLVLIPRIFKVAFPYRYFYDDGRIKEEGSHIHSKKEGIIKWYYPNEKVNSEINYSNGVIDGSAKWFYEGGQLKFEGTYKNGKKSGLGRGYYENGQLASEGTYNEGEQEGVWRDYYENGQLKAEVTFKKGLKAGVERWYNENGQLSSEGISKDGKPEGIYKWYHENGQLKSEANYINGEIIGEIKNY